MCVCGAHAGQAKKVKKGKMTQEEFEAALRGAGVDSEAEDDDEYDDSD